MTSINMRSNIHDIKVNERWKELTWKRGNSQTQYSFSTAPIKRPCESMCLVVKHPLLTAKSWFVARPDPFEMSVMFTQFDLCGKIAYLYT